MNPIKALLVDDHASFGESVVRALRSEPGLEISSCTTITAALQVLQQQRVDVVLLDHDLGSERASQFLPAALRSGFDGRVLVVTAWVGDAEARLLLRQGVAGIFTKESSLGALVEGIRRVHAGETLLEGRYRRLAEPGGAQQWRNARPRPFNERLRRVLRFVLEGLSNKEIAARLRISESYVKALMQVLFKKTGVRTRGQLVRVALEHYRDEL